MLVMVKRPLNSDAELRLQLALVVGLQRRLRRRQVRPHRVVDQVEHEAAAFDAVALGVQPPHRLDALAEHAIAALRVGEELLVVGQRRDRPRRRCRAKNSGRYSLLSPVCGCGRAARSGCAAPSRAGRAPARARRSRRSRGCSSGAPPVMSSFAMPGGARGSPGTARCPRGDIISRRAGEASTWQWRHCWLHSLVMLTCSVSSASGAQLEAGLAQRCDFEDRASSKHHLVEVVLHLHRCTSVMPACITAATCTASIICSGLAPVSRHCVV